MRKWYLTLVLVAIIGLAGAAFAQNPVNIVYPIQGGTYPMTDPAIGPLQSALITASFSVTCDGDHKVEWGFESIGPVGSATFHDQISVQFVHKLPGGSDLFWVVSDCGQERVEFNVGS